PQLAAANCRDRAQIAHRAGIGACGRLSCSWRSLCRILVRFDRATWLCSWLYPEGRCQPRQPTGRTNRLCVVVRLLCACEGEQRKHPCREEQERCGKDSQVEERGAAEFFYFHDWVSGDEAYAGYLPDVRRRMCYTFSSDPSGIFFFDSRVKTFFSKPGNNVCHSAHAA